MSMQKLEGRLLLSATLEDGVLTVEGTQRRDRIVVEIMLTPAGDSIEVTINGKSQPLPGPPLPPMEEVVLRGGAGNDSITLRTIFGELATTVDGGKGNDRINILARGARTLGGKGNDRITIDSNGEDPNGVVFGGGGNDRITGSMFANNLHGGGGNDTLFGGEGDDRLFGDGGNDVIKGNAGVDLFFGGDGNDRLYAAGEGGETVDGGDGRDRTFEGECSPTTQPDVLVSIERGGCN